MNRPLISIIINNYNYGQFIRRAIDSALNQTYRPIEIIVVDDGSTDNSRAMIEAYGDAIHPVFKANGGQDSSFNVGFASSQGDIVCFLDADDVFMPDKLEKVATCFNEDPRVGWCFHTIQLKDLDTSEVLGNTLAFPGAACDRSRFCDFRSEIRLGRLPFYPASTSGLCFRRHILDQILPMTETFVKTSADRYVRAAAIGLSPGYFLAEELTIQGIHGRNVSTLRKDRPFIPEREMIAAYLVRTHFPSLAQYADRLFARGLWAYKQFVNSSEKALLDVEPEYEALIQDYWQLCSPISKTLIVGIELYHSRPWRREGAFIALASKAS